MIREVAGRQNHSVKLARKLQYKKYRRDRGLLVGEGMDLLLAAADSGADIREILVRPELLRELPAGLRERAAGVAPTAGMPGPSDSAVSSGLGASGLDIGVCDQATLDYASSLGGSADVVFICGLPDRHLSDIDLGGSVVFYLDCVGDPGNVGTIVRSAVAFGLGGVVCSPGTADPYGPKSLRGGMGAQFSLPVVVDVSPGDLRARIGVLAQRGWPVPTVWAADSHEGADVRGLRLASGAVIVLGSERSGPGGGWEDVPRLRVPQQRFDSLNVAMAATVIAYELSRMQDQG